MPKAPLKKNKKLIKAKKLTNSGRKPRSLQDEKEEHTETSAKQSNDGFKCGACKEVHPTVDALKGKNEVFIIDFGLFKMGIS